MPADKDNITTPADLRRAEFVQHFLSDPQRNATQAAIKSGYAADTANRTAHRLLRHPDVAATIKAAETAALASAGVTLDRIIAELAAHAFGGMDRFLKINSDGDPVIDLSDCTPEDLRLLSDATIEDFTDGRRDGSRAVRRVRIKMYDKLAALIALSKFFVPVNGAKLNETADALTELLQSVQGTAFPVANQNDEY